jgi:hypothetical protein
MTEVVTPRSHKEDPGFCPKKGIKSERSHSTFIMLYVWAPNHEPRVPPPPTPWGLRWSSTPLNLPYISVHFEVSIKVQCKDLVLRSGLRLSWLIVLCFFSVPPCGRKCRDITSVKPLLFTFRFSQIYYSPCCMTSVLSSLRNSCYKINNKIIEVSHPPIAWNSEI